MRTSNGLVKSWRAGGAGPLKRGKERISGSRYPLLRDPPKTNQHFAGKPADGVLGPLIVGLLNKDGPIGKVRTSLGKLLTADSRERLVVWLHGLSMRPPLGRLRFGDLRRLEPISRKFGFDRGLPIDRHYMERFLSVHASDIRGHVLEIGDDRYIRKFGRGRVTQSDVLHVQEGNPQATIVADLAHADHLPPDVFDCIVFTATLDFIYDMRAVIRTLCRILKPGGILLAAFHGISQISRNDMSLWGDYWRFTDLSARRLFGEVFSPEDVKVEPFGNVLTAVAFLHGVAAEELNPEELDYCDPDYQIVIAVRAEKSEGRTITVGSPSSNPTGPQGAPDHGLPRHLGGKVNPPERD